MADREWLKNLANSNYSDGQWFINEEETTSLALARLDESISLLMEEANEACDIFNAHTRNEKNLHILPIKHANKQLRGFIILLGAVQLKLEVEENILVSTLISVKGFTKKSKIIHRMTPKFDAFGTLLWTMDNSLLLSVELIIKRMFEDLISAAYELGEVF